VTAPALAPGVHVWVWTPPADMDKFARVADDAASLGIVGLIPQNGLDAPAWAARSKGKADRLAHERGLQLTLGLGMDGNQGWRDDLGKVSAAIRGCLDYSAAGMLNWESKWGDERADKDRANRVVADVLRTHPTADQRLVDAPWWAPLYIWRTLNGQRRKAWTHPNAPTAEFGRVCKTRFVQAYGANVPGSPDGASQRMLDWSRDPSQYPALGTPADRVQPSLQGYERTVTDHVRMFLAHDTVCLWHFRALDAECIAALRFVQALRAHGYTGPGADVRFQMDRRIPGPEWVGPRALVAAGVSVSTNGLKFRRKSA